MNKKLVLFMAFLCYATVESETVLQQPETDLENGILDSFNEAEMGAAWNSLFVTDNFTPNIDEKIKSFTKKD